MFVVIAVRGEYGDDRTPLAGFSNEFDAENACAELNCLQKQIDRRDMKNGLIDHGTDYYRVETLPESAHDAIAQKQYDLGLSNVKPENDFARMLRARREARCA